MSEKYSFTNFQDYTKIKKRVDMWCPFTIESHHTLTVPNIRTTPMVYSEDVCTDDGRILEALDSEWEPVRVSTFSADICEPAEYISMWTLQGLEPGLYQCITVDKTCDCERDINDDSECENDHMCGWSLLRYVGDAK